MNRQRLAATLAPMMLACMIAGGAYTVLKEKKPEFASAGGLIVAVAIVSAVQGVGYLIGRLRRRVETPGKREG